MSASITGIGTATSRPSRRTGLMSLGSGEPGEADAALTRYGMDVAQQASAGLKTSPGEVAAARWLDAEDATTQHAIGWARQHEPATALRIAIALTPWWMLRGRTEGYVQLSAAVADTQPEGDLRADAQIALGLLSQPADDTAAVLRHFTAARDMLSSRVPRRKGSRTQRSTWRTPC